MIKAETIKNMKAHKVSHSLEKKSKDFHLDSSTLIKMLHDTRGSTTIYHTDMANVAEVITEINSVQRNLRLVFAAERNPILRAGLWAYNKFQHFVGSNGIYTSVSDMLGRNLDSMHKLYKVTDAILSQAKQEHDRLSGVVDKSIDQMQESSQTKRNLEHTLPGLFRKYVEVRTQSEMQDENNCSPNFDLKRRKLDLERQIDMLGYGAYSMAVDRSSSTAGITQYYENMERLFRFAYIAAQKIKESAGQIVDVLGNTKSAYESFGNFFVAARACRDGVLVLTDYHEKLNQTFTEGLKGITSIINSTPELAIFRDTNPALSNLIGDIELGEYQHMQTVASQGYDR